MSTDLDTAIPSPLPTPSAARWRPLRAGVQNIWQYDHATRFVFHNGRLLLRGRNGSGKTKVLEVLLPFLLEGRMDPARLDPFGTRSRKMRYNLLHPATPDVTINVGYVWLEFGRLDADGTARYLTVGAGMKARRTSDSVESWFFLAHDRRIDIELDLLDTDRRPRTRQALEEELGDHGRVLASGREYKSAVNRELFDLPSDQYDALVEALLRLRQPHLSERLDPDAVGGVLSDSLPPLDAERVHEVAEGFERLEAHRRELEDRNRTLTAIGGFLDDYREYVATIAAVRARELSSADSRVRRAAERVTATQTELELAEQSEQQLVEAVAATERAERDGQARVEAIKGSDEYRAVQQLADAEEAQRREAARHEEAERRRQRADTEVEQAQRELGAVELAVGAQEDQVRDRAREALRAAGEADLGDAGQVLEVSLAAATSADQAALDGARGLRQATLASRRGGIAVVREANAVLAARQGEARHAEERLDDAEQRLRERQARVHDAEEAVRAAIARHGEDVIAWAGRLEILSLADEELDRLCDEDPLDTAAAAARIAEPTRRLLDAEVADAGLSLADVEQRVQRLRTERDELAGRRHVEPPAAPWRRADRQGRAGAPLYLLLEPTDALEPAQQARVEAALGAAGLLDAWVTPDGTLLDARTLDTVLLPTTHAGAPAAGRTLADVLRPTPTGGVDEATIAAITASIGLLDGDGQAPEEPAAWVATDGRFRLGPLHGRAHADALAYLGATAREQARQRRLAELEAGLEALAVEQDAAAARLEQARHRREVLDSELEALPSPAAVETARAALTAAVDESTSARAERDELAAALEPARRKVEHATQHRDQAAADARLAAHVDDLDGLAAATEAWAVSALEWIGAVELLVERQDRLAEATRGIETARKRLADEVEALQVAERNLVDARSRVAALSEIAGASRETVLAALREAEEVVSRAGSELRRLREERLAARGAVAAAESEAGRAAEERDDAETAREAAAAGFRTLAGLGVLAHLFDEPGEALGDPAAWPTRTALEHARQAAKRGPQLPEDAEQTRRLLESTQNLLNRRHVELQRELVAGIRLFARIDHDVMLYDVQYQGKTYRLETLAAELREDVAERDGRLRGQEQDLLETFLAGELHEHLRGRVRDAAELVAHMNAQLARCPTASGLRLRLRWAIGEDAPPGAAQAVELLLRGAALLTDEQRAELRAYLHERLRAAREGEAAASLQERIAAAFDYRRWYAFTLEFTEHGAAGWRKLTRTTHGAGSGGEKAVLLHLPLFAAMAAHYDACPGAPRLIVLDEVFAGIDRGTRGQLMGLLVSLNLDALLTSHEEWGFYEELDGISTYHLSRDPDVPGVLAEWFLWDGRTRWELSAVTAGT